MCHLAAPWLLLTADARDLDFRERLAMTLGTPVVLAAAEFDDDDFVLAALRDDLLLDLAAGYERRADFDLRAFADEEDLIEGHGIADGRVELLDADSLALTRAVLLTASTENGIHDEVLLRRNWGAGP